MTPGDNIPPEDTLALAGTAMGAGNALTAPAAGRLGMFIGQGAKNVDQDALKRAMTMESMPFNPLEVRRWEVLTDKMFKGSPLSDAELREYEKLATKSAPSREDIFGETGWFKGKDGRWRTEIPDFDSTLKMAPEGSRAGFKSADWYNSGRLDGKVWYEIPYVFGKGATKRTLPDFLDHEELYQQYPFLRDVEVGPTHPTAGSEGLKGSHDPAANKILLSGGTEEDVRSTLLHEIQHAIQQHEDFARGGNTDMFLPQDFKPRMTYAKTLRDDVHKELRDKGFNPYSVENVIEKIVNGQLTPADFPKMSKYDQDWINKLEEHPNLLNQVADMMQHYLPLRNQLEKAYASYRNLHGEAEARLTQDRMELGPVDRMVNAPWKDFDVPEEELIVSGLDGRPRRLVPVQGNPLNSQTPR